MRGVRWSREGAGRGADGKETNGVPVSEVVMCWGKSRGEWEGGWKGGLDWLTCLPPWKCSGAPFWLKFSLSSIIAVAGLNLQSCRYQTLSERSSPQPEPPPHPPTANLILSTRSFNCISSFLVSSWLVRNQPPYDSLFSLTLSLSHALFVSMCLFIYSSHSASKLLALKTLWEWCLCVSASFLQWRAFPTQGF